ncbi:MAG: LysR family transcriptional regulator [Acidimicrobiales bacterium]
MIDRRSLVKSGLESISITTTTDDVEAGRHRPPRDPTASHRPHPGSSPATTKWQGIELRHLLAFRAVISTGSFSAAARELGYTQSGVSQQVAALERLVGASLFNRPGGPRPVRLTEIGEALLPHADAVIARLHAAESDVAALSTGQVGSLRVGVLQSVGARVLPGLLSRFLESWPGVEVHITPALEPRHLLTGVERGELDLAFVNLPLPPGPFLTRHLFDDPYVFVTSTSSDLADRRHVSLEDIARMPLIGWRADADHAQILDLFTGLPHRPRFPYRFDDNPTLQGCVAAGLAHALLPWLTLDPGHPGTRLVPVIPPVQPRHLVAVWHQDLHQTAAATAFLDIAANSLSNLDIDTKPTGLRSRPPRRTRRQPR